MTDIKKLTLWHDIQGREVTIQGYGNIYDKQTGSGKIVKIPQVTIASRDLPLDLTGWCITVTDTDGAHYHSEVKADHGSSSHRKLVLYQPRGALIDDYSRYTQGNSV